jgi:hypothetical protein
MKFVFLLIVFFTFNNAALVKNSDYVYDTKNSMVWQDSKDNITLQLSYNEAIDYCKNGKFSGKNNWRLATRNDYKFIINKKRKDEHKINKAFKNSVPYDYWIGETTWRSFGKYAYYVFFKSGTIYYQNKTYKKFVRCVR